ncbi:unnamed protein product [Durusdinium trenchii]|uniref:Uncharacterized protein n=1 Tax=Durusdinium trenchii TaxID=1381693 RepID=A0ABP0NFM0_9DINO
MNLVSIDVQSQLLKAKGFEETIEVLKHASFNSQVIFTEPADVGFSCIARKRAFQIFVDRTKGRFVANPAEIYQALCDGLGSRHLTIGHLMDFASSEDLKLELGLQGKSMDSYPGNLLSSFETKNKDEYERILSNKYSDGIPADQVYCLGQNPLKVPKLSNGGVMPAFTKTDKLLWHHGLKRHVLAIEKFAAHGIGVTADLAKLLGTPVFNVTQMKNPHPVAGNGQHAAVAALVLASALLSIELFEELPEPTKPLASPSSNDDRKQAGTCFAYSPKVPSPKSATSHIYIVYLFIYACDCVGYIYINETIEQHLCIYIYMPVRKAPSCTGPS